MKFYGLKHRGKTSCTNFTEIEYLGKIYFMNYSIVTIL